VVLVIDGLAGVNENKSIQYLTPSNLSNVKYAEALSKKYAKKSNQLRWSLKSVLLRYLLQEQGIQQAIYLDNDIYFHGNPEVIWSELNTACMLLTPHRYPSNPQDRQNWLEANFRVGLYNAGFLAVSAAAIPALEWWASCCLYRCEKNYWRGLFDDQKYLDLIPVKYDGVKVLKHAGCNVAGWNFHELQWRPSSTKVLLNEQDELIFMHYNQFTFDSIARTNNSILHEHLHEYVQTLKKYKPNFKPEESSLSNRFSVQFKLFIWRLFNRMNGNYFKKQI